VEESELDVTDAFSDDKIRCEKVKDHVNKAVDFVAVVNPQTLADVIAFLEKFRGNCIDDDRHVVDALFRIERPFTFVVWFCNNLHLFWN